MLKDFYKYFTENPGNYAYVNKRDGKIVYTGESLNLKARLRRELGELEKGKFPNRLLQEYYNSNKENIILVELKVYQIKLPKKPMKDSKVKQRYKKMIVNIENKIIYDFVPMFNIRQTSERFQMAL